MALSVENNFVYIPHSSDKTDGSVRVNDTSFIEFTSLIVQIKLLRKS